jgi:transmembrane sensor
VTDKETDQDTAAAWAVRLDTGSATPMDLRELDIWLAQGERRPGALLRAQATLCYLDRGRALAELSERANDTRPGFGRRRLFFGAGRGLVAAGVISMLSLGSFAIWSGMPESGGSVEIATAIGEVRRVPLGDGSVAAINTGSVLHVSMKAKQRLVDLDAGEAWFQVAHDRSRPFIVAAGTVRVQAVGTAFSVRRHGDGADILVTEGVVETWVEGQSGPRTRIAAGSGSFVQVGKPQPANAATIDGIDRKLAWRNGDLALDGETLAYAVEEMNRYNDRKLIIDDPALGREPLVGYFRTSQPEDFAQAAAAITGARTSVRNGKIHLSK